MTVGKINFGNLDYIIVDRFEYNEVEYMYIFEDITEKIKGKGISGLDNIDVKADFIFKCNDGKYENVTDDELYQKLMFLENKRNSLGVNAVLKDYFKA